MTEKYLIGLDNMRSGLFRIHWILEDATEEIEDTRVYKKKFQLLGSQCDRVYNINYEYNRRRGPGTITVEEARCNSLSPFKNLPQPEEELKGSEESNVPAKVIKAFQEPICMWVYLGTDSSEIQLTSNCDKWEQTVLCFPNPPEVIILWMDFGTKKPFEKKIFRGLIEMFDKQNQCDVQFRFNNGELVGAHVVILSAVSPVFAAMFQESKERQVKIVDIEVNVFRQLLIYFYSGNTPNLNEENFTQKLFEVAARYEVDTLKSECVGALLERVRIDNAIELMIWSNLHSIPELLVITMKFVAENFEVLCSRLEWIDLVKNQPGLYSLIKKRIPVLTSVENV
jgi:hypothetical protein